MEMRVADRVLNYEQEMKEADAYGNIRLLHIDNTTSPVPLDEASVRHGGWQVLLGENTRLSGDGLLLRQGSL